VTGCRSSGPIARAEALPDTVVGTQLYCRAVSIVPARATVRPRIFSAESSTPKLLEDEIAELLAAGRPCDVDLVGAPGAGKTTALAHVAAVFAADPRLLLSDEGSHALPSAGSSGVVVTVRATATRPRPHRRRIDLAPWDDDDVLEYLRARHADRIGGVFAAWCARRDHDLAVVPSICTAVLDQLAAEPSLTDPLAAVLHALREQPEQLPPHALPPAPLASDTVMGFITAIATLEVVRRQEERVTLRLRWTPGLVTALAHVLSAEPRHLPLLRTLATRPDARHPAFVLSALRVAGEQLAEGQPLLGDLCRAWLRGIDLSERLVQARLNLADLSDAKLQGAHFDGCTLLGAQLSRASAPHSRWTAAAATGLRARGLDARSSRWLKHANLSGAHLAGARFDDAIFEHARLFHADLRGAHLPRCSLVDADFAGAKLDDTDLTETNLTRARFADSDMRTVHLDAAMCALTEFARCDLSGSRFAALSAPGTKFTDADLTAAHWSNADLRDARFLRTSLADIDLEGADLRGASFDRSSFHLGSSRSGLVDSVIACEGSRTGFYTDETLEGHFLAPEAVRKANLRNCDLRGATFEETDFYLVDLRGAKLDPEQKPYLQRCRAILDKEP
jgi:uncharacterized protein YjbI with pentapeptide repeats